MRTRDASLSIVIPNYNKGKYISFTLKSIIEQTRLPDEIIIVDDCSTDNSKEIIDSFAREYPKVFKVTYFEKNHGVQYCRNYGAKVAASEYICFVDSDDVYLRNDCIEKQMEYVGEKKLVGVYQLLIDSSNNVISCPVSKRIKRQYKKHPIYFFYIMESFMPWPFHYIFEKREFFSVGGYDNPYSLYEDAEIMLKLVLNKIKPVWVDIEGKGYRVDANDDGHISHASVERITKAKEYIWQKYRKALPLKTRAYMLFINLKRQIKRCYVKKSREKG